MTLRKVIAFASVKVYCLITSGSHLYNINQYIANILKVKDENNNVKNSTTFFNYMFLLKMMR